jgi:glycerophosphoryl diester phosphodiesterase
MNAIKNVKYDSDLVMVAAHRGVHAVWGNPDYTDTPENSLQSIYNAATHQTEIIELDIRLTQDGVPILTHDGTWGRETNVGNNWGACCFNPWGYYNPGLTVADGDPGELGGGTDNSWDPQAAVNPNVNDWSLSSVQQSDGGLLLRNSLNFAWSTWQEHPPTLQQALNYIYQNRWGVVLALDIKDANAMQTTFHVLAPNHDFNGITMVSSTIFKFDAAHIYRTPEDFQADFDGNELGMNQPDYNFMNIMPVYQTSHVAPGLYGNEVAILDSVDSYLASGFTAGVELNMKQYGGILTNTYNTVWRSSGNQNQALAQFNPYAEWINPNDPTQTYQFFYSNGYCCAPLSNYFYNDPRYGWPSDTQDLRYDWNFVWTNNQGIKLITTDNSQAMGYWLWQQGKRNTNYFR